MNPIQLSNFVPCSSLIRPPVAVNLMCELKGPHTQPVNWKGVGSPNCVQQSSTSTPLLVYCGCNQPA